MGTDVYLEWEGVEDFSEGLEEEFENITQLRANIWMDKENAVLRKIFGECFAGEENYSFDQNVEVMRDTLKKYISGEEIEETPTAEKMVQEKMRSSILEALEKMASNSGEGEVTIQKGGAMESQEERVEWAKEVIRFFALGKVLEQNGNNPRVIVSW